MVSFEDRLSGMLEANNYTTIDILKAFLGPVIYGHCEESGTAPFTAIFTKYTTLLSFLNCWNMYSNWLGERLHDLNHSIRRFKHEALTFFRKYHLSALNTTTWHIQAYVIADIKKFQGVCYIMADFFKSSHKVFNRWYGETSKQCFSSMSETMHCQEGKLTPDPGHICQL